jgi:hypothetical protein
LASITDDDLTDADESVPAWMAALEDARDPNEISNLSTVESPMLETLTVDEIESGLFDTLTVDGTFEEPVTSSALPEVLSAEPEEAPSWLFAEPPATVAVRPEQPEATMPSVSFDPYEDLLLTAPPAEDGHGFAPSISEETPVDAAVDVNVLFGEDSPVLDAQADVDEIMMFGDDETETATDADSNDGELDWLSAMAANAPSATPVKVDDILTDSARPLDDFSFGENADSSIEVAGDEMDFSSLGFRADDDTLMLDSVPNAANENEFDWLSDATPVGSDAPASSAFDLGNDASDEIGWLSAAAPVGSDVPASSAFDLGNDASDEIDWLSDAAPAGVSSAASVFGLEDAGDDMGWLTDAEPAPDATEILSKEDDFALSFLDDQDQPSTVLGSSFFDDEEAPAELSDEALFGLSFDSSNGKPAATFNAITDDDDLFMAEETPVELSEANAISAPDWLNALAPGLEVDTDAVDVAPDGEYLGGGRGDYGWLNNLVQEEQRPPVMVSKPRTARFPFSTPPAWLQVVREETHPVSSVADTVDFDGNGLPDWLDSIEDDDDDAK